MVALVIDGLTLFGDDVFVNYWVNEADVTVIRFAHSPDGGTSWAPCPAILDLTGTLRRALLLTRDPWIQRRLHYSRERFSGGRYEVSYTASTDLGVTFPAEVFLSPVDGVLSDGPHLAADTSGFVAVTWRDGRYVGPSGFGAAIYYRHSMDGGQTFLPEQLLSVQHRGLESSVGVEKTTGVVGVVWRDELSGGHSYIVIRLSFDKGNTWSGVYTLNPGSVFISGEPVIAVEKEYVHTSWRYSNGPSERNQIYYRRGRVIRDSTAISLGVERAWRMVSVPVGVVDYSLTSVFPTAQTQAFFFDGEAYTGADTLHPGIGYWVKFDTTQSIEMRGATVIADSIPVVEGWNMVGTISYPVVAGLISTDPPGIIMSGFYTANAQGVYEESELLRPGRGYWVKAAQQGVIVLQR